MSTRGIPILAVIALALTVPAAYAAEPVDAPQQLIQAPQQLIKDVVYNELTDHKTHSFFAYLDTKRTGQQTVVKAEVETRGGRVYRMLETDGQPLTAEQRQNESRRLESLLHDSSQQQKLLRDYQGDEDRIARIIGLLPEGFVYQYDGVEGDDIRLKYQPNPAFKPPTYEARVFHGMAGTIWIDGRTKRLCRLEGQLVSNVDFGYGLLGRLDKGGTFNMERVEVTPGNWKTRVLNVHITGHVILLKSIGKDQEEVRSGFHQVAADMNLQQAEAMLETAAPAQNGIAHLEAAQLKVDPKGRQKPAGPLALK